LGIRLSHNGLVVIHAWLPVVRIGQKRVIAGVRRHVR
jgi:hypothetical protein